MKAYAANAHCGRNRDERSWKHYSSRPGPSAGGKNYCKYDFATADPLKPHTIVAAEGEVIYGFATTAPSHDSGLPNCGELCALYVDPKLWGHGIGVSLMLAARARLFELGFRNAFLWVLVGNNRAEHFYRSDGWTSDGASRIDSVWGVTVNEVRYRRGL